jgi:hypothetical protein
MSETTAANEVDDVADATVRESALTRKLREQTDESIHVYLKSLADSNPIKVSVIREEPKFWEEKKIAGSLETFDDPISEKEIREQFGGGKFKIVVTSPDARGSWTYAGSRKVTIAGDPILGPAFKKSSGSGDDPSLIRHAMTMAADQAARDRERADRAEEMRNEHRGPDPSSQMMMEELRDLRHAMSAKDDRLFEMATAKPESSAMEMLFGKSLEGESARMTGIREQFQSELRTKNEAHAAEIKQLNDRLDRMLQRAEDSNAREITSLERAHDNALTLLHASYKGQIAGYEREIAFIGRQLDTESRE